MWGLRTTSQLFPYLSSTSYHTNRYGILSESCGNKLRIRFDSCCRHWWSSSSFSADRSITGGLTMSLLKQSYLHCASGVCMQRCGGHMLMCGGLRYGILSELCEHNLQIRFDSYHRHWWWSSLYGTDSIGSDPEVVDTSCLPHVLSTPQVCPSHSSTRPLYLDSCNRQASDGGRGILVRIMKINCGWPYRNIYLLLK